MICPCGQPKYAMLISLLHVGGKLVRALCEWRSFAWCSYNFNPCDIFFGVNLTEGYPKIS